MFLPFNDKQFGFWIPRRSGLPNINIARSFNISSQAVSRALLMMNEHIEKTLTRTNHIEVERVNADLQISCSKNRGNWHDDKHYRSY